MANARREVDLVVKAKDDAAKVIDAITGAINKMIGSQENLLKSAGKVDGTFGELVSAVGEFEKVLKGSSGTDRLAQDLAKAEKAMASLRAQVTQTEGDLAGLKQQQNAAATSTAKLRTESQKLDGQLASQNVKLEKAEKKHKEIVAALREHTTEQNKIARSIPTTTNNIFKQIAAITEQQAKYDSLSAAMLATAEPAKKLVREFNTAGTTLQKMQVGLTETRAKLEAQIGSLEQAQAVTRDFEASIAGSNAALTGQRGEIAQTTATLKNLKDEIKESVTSTRQLEDAVEKTGLTLDRTKGQTAAAEQNFEKLGASVAEAEARMDALAAAARGPLKAAMSAQQSALDRIKNAYASVQGEIAQVATAISRAGVPTREMSETFVRLQGVLRDIKAELNTTRAGLQGMQNDYRGLTGDTAQLAGVTERFEASLKQSAASLKASQAAAAGAAGSARTLATASAQAASNMGRVAQEVRQTAGATSTAAASTNKLSDAYRRLYGESRQAMSYTQRLRGEVLSLISAYGGIFGVIQALTGVVDATAKIESAQVRLQSLTGGNIQAAGEEFEFVRRTATRLGIDIGLLADEYTKFAAATKNTVIQGKSTRDIFMRVAEAGRVTGLSMDDMSGIFRAIIQIASKGKVQLEELSGQLGDRLPGALQIMADGLGVTTEELLSMTKEGQVSSAALLNFAIQLDKRYGEQLPAALKKTAAQMGFFQNAVTEALLAFGQGGFIEGFNDLLGKLTETLKSADFKTFLQTLSAGFGLLAQALGVVAENWRLLTIAALAFVGIKLLPFLGSALTAFANFTTSVKASNAAMLATSSAAAGAAGGVGIFARALIGLRAVLTGLLASTGVGLAIVAISTGITYWASATDSATEAMERHNEIVQQAKGAYDQAGLSVQEWRKEVAALTNTEILLNTADLSKQLQDARDEIGSIANSLRDAESMIPSLNKNSAVDKQRAELAKLVDEFVKGSRDAANFRDELDKIAQSATNDFIKSTAEGLILASKNTGKWEEAIKRNNDILIARNGTAKEAEAALRRLAGVTDEAAAATDKASASVESYKSALEGIKAFIPGLAQELERLKDSAKLDSLVADLMKMGPLSRQQLDLISQARSSINSKYTDYAAQYTSTRGKPQGEELESLVRSATKLAAENSYDVKDILTLIHYESGFRSQVMGGAGGNYFGLFQASPDVRQQYGIGPGSSVEEQVKALGKYLTDRGVKPGDGLLPMYAAVNAGNAKNINASDENNGGLPGSVLDKTLSEKMKESRRISEGLLEAYSGISKEVETTVDKQEEQRKKLAEMVLSEQEALRIAEVENKFKDADLVTRTTEVELEKARLAAKREGKDLDPELEAAIRKRVELQEREKSNQDQINDKKKAAEEVEGRFNALIQQREALLKQAEALSAAGNTAGAAQAIQQATGLKTAIDQAAESAIAMWQKIGGPEAQAAIEKIRLAALESKNLSNAGNATAAMWQQTGQIIGDNLVNAFDEFAQAVANGENAWKALGVAIQKAAAQILIDIGKMIVRQAIFNAISGIFGLKPGANGLFHEGTGSGTFGSQAPNRSRSISPMAWSNAPRFHTGYNGGLKNNEMAAIVERNEAILTEDSPFHPQNQNATLAAAAGAGRASGMPNIKIVNAIDAGDFVSEGLNTGVGETAMLNFMRKNKNAFKEVMS